MRALLSIIAVFSISLPAFGLPVTHDLPEPETLALLSIGVIGLLLSRRNKK
jgi:hypothetical protein